MGRVTRFAIERLRLFAREDSSRFWPVVVHGIDHLAYLFRRRSQASVKPLSEATRSAVANLRHHGFYSIPGFVSQDICADLRRRMDSSIAEFPTLVHPATPYDSRLFGIENIDNAFRFFTDHPLLIEIASAYLGEPARAAFTLGARLEAMPGNPGSGGGWHRDSNHRQIKAMVYLSDVSEENGPFQLLYESQKLFRSIRDNYCIAKQKYGEVRWTEEQVECVLTATGKDRLRTFSGSAGTLLIFDSSMIHRGAPIQKETRYAMTNYFSEVRAITPVFYSHFAPVAGFKECGTALK